MRTSTTLHPSIAIPMKTMFLYGGILVGALAAGAWFARDSAVVRQATQAAGFARDSTPATARTLAAAGVHKCRTAAGIVYLDKPCPKGSTELAANGGAVTVMSFPKAVPTPGAAASGVLGGPLVKGFSKEEIDKLRDQQIEAAANR
jgi:hypothetical protein